MTPPTAISIMWYLEFLKKSEHVSSWSINQFVDGTSEKKNIKGGKKEAGKGGRIEKKSLG